LSLILTHLRDFAPFLCTNGCAACSFRDDRTLIDRARGWLMSANWS